MKHIKIRKIKLKNTDFLVRVTTETTKQNLQFKIELTAAFKKLKDVSIGGYLCKFVETFTTPILVIQKKVSPKGFSVSRKK